MGDGKNSPLRQSASATKGGVPKKRRKKRPKKKRPPEPSDLRPGFARSYPQDPTLEALLGAFEAGNFAAVRRGTATLVENSDDEAIVQAAQDLRRRIHAGPTAIYLLAISALLLAFLSGYFWLNAH